MKVNSFPDLCIWIGLPHWFQLPLIITLFPPYSHRNTVGIISVCSKEICEMGEKREMKKSPWLTSGVFTGVKYSSSVVNKVSKSCWDPLWCDPPSNRI